MTRTGQATGATLVALCLIGAAGISGATAIQSAEGVYVSDIVLHIAQILVVGLVGVVGYFARGIYHKHEERLNAIEEQLYDHGPRIRIIERICKLTHGDDAQRVSGIRDRMDTPPKDTLRGSA